MPRNVVTLVPRRRLLRRRGDLELREAVEAYVVERYRARVEDDPRRLVLDFPRRLGRRAARTEVVTGLDRAAPGWRRVFRLYPTDSTLRDTGE